MKITAYKDPITGVLFEDEKALTTFQANRKREEATAEKRRQLKAAEDRARKTLARELSSRDQFCDLVRTMYEHVLNNAKCMRGKKPLEVRDVRLQGWKITARLELVVEIEVVLSGNPDYTYSDPFLRLAPSDALYPFTLYGSGRVVEKRGSYTYDYGIQADLTKLPKLLAKLRELAKLAAAEDEHEKAVESATVSAQGKDASFAKLMQAAETTEQALEAAQAAHREARGAVCLRGRELAAQVADQMPFPKQLKLDKLAASVGLPRSAGTVLWRTLGSGLKEALTAEA